MADQKISDLGTLSGSSVATDDFTVVVDKSDTTMAATGTDKQITAVELAKAVTLVGVVVNNDQSGTTYTLVASDQGKVIRCTNASAVTVTVPPNSSVAFPTGTVINVYAAGAGGTTVAAGSGVTIRNNTVALTQYREVSLRKDGTDEWVRLG